jgi:hypothetical protein
MEEIRVSVRQFRRWEGKSKVWWVRGSGAAQQGSEPNARLLRRDCGASRGSPGSFAAQKRLAQDDKANCTTARAFCRKTLHIGLPWNPLLVRLAINLLLAETYTQRHSLLKE